MWDKKSVIGCCGGDEKTNDHAEPTKVDKIKQKIELIAIHCLQELKFTEVEMRKMRRDKNLMIQGAHLNKEKELFQRQRETEKTRKLRKKDWNKSRQCLKHSIQQKKEECKQIE